MRTNWFPAVVALLGGGSLARAEEPARLPPELRWIPANSVGFVHIRFGELWDSRAVKALFQFIMLTEPRTIERFEPDFGISLAEIDRATLLLPDVEADAWQKGVVLRITTREAYDRKKLVDRLG